MSDFFKKIMAGRYEDLQTRYGFLIDAFEEKKFAFRRILSSQSKSRNRGSEKAVAVSKKRVYPRRVYEEKIRALVAY